MKKQVLSIFTAVCVFSAFPNLLSCQCVDADCRLGPKTIQAKTPQCHPAAAPVTGKEGSRTECCGKCQIEKTAVLAKEISPASDTRRQNTPIEIRSSMDLHEGLDRASFSYEAFSKPPPGFFIQHILNTTFSFRAPPRG